MPKLFIWTIFFLLINIETSMSQKIDKTFFKVINEITLEGLLNNNPLNLKINVDKDENFIVTDFALQQVSLFNKKGTLLKNISRTGRGPGEFERPTSSIRLKNGNLVVAEFSGEINIFNSNGDSLLASYSTPVFPLSSIKKVSNNEIILIGRMQKDRNHNLLHKYNFSKKQVTKSFFPLPLNNDLYSRILFNIGELCVADLNSEFIVTAATPLNTVYVFSLDGSLIKKLQVDTDLFIPIKETDKIHPSKYASYLSSFSTISNIILKEDSILLQYAKYDIKNTRSPLSGSEIKYHLAKIDFNGNLLSEIENVTKLFSINPNSSNLIFSKDAKENFKVLEANVKKL
ncbi:MAG: 6-bladed beta-propeller [Balneola sp.]